MGIITDVQLEQVI